jgi:signal peptidase II
VAAVPVTDTAALRGRAYARALGVAAVVVVLDQLSKQLIVSSIAPGQVVKVLPGIELVRWRNAGVAFSFLSSGGALVYVLIVAAMLALIAYLAARPASRLLWLPTGMLLGGAIGNLIDRVRLGAVTDFIKLPHWPAFNIADASITIGVIVLVLVLEVGRGERR